VVPDVEEQGEDRKGERKKRVPGPLLSVALVNEPGEIDPRGAGARPTLIRAGKRESSVPHRSSEYAREDVTYPDLEHIPAVR
jgi:hypothetical protein